MEVQTNLGCDIHSYAEVRKDGVWEKVGDIFRNPYFRDDEPIGDWQCWDEEGNTKVAQHADDQHAMHCWRRNNYPTTDHPYMQRNYDLFAMLANVRNGRGFADVDTGDGFKPIAMPRGLPEDVDPIIKCISDQWGDDAHSHSWLTLAELLKYDWYGQETHCRGYVGEKASYSFGDSLEEMQAEGRTVPHSWSGFISGSKIVKMTKDKYDWLKSTNTLPQDRKIYVIVEWVSTYYDSAKNFVDNTLYQLAQLGPPDDVRITFFFDN